MGRARTIARRTVLTGAVAVAGGVAFGTWAVRRDPANPLLDRLDDGEAAITPHVLIDATGVTLITPRAEVGQGATSIQAALLAEELDLDWRAIRTRPGPPSPAYYNAVVVGEGLPIAATDTGYLARAGRAASGAVSKVLGVQVTGGSSTVPDAYDRLRAAGAVARETLKLAASRQSGLAVEDLTTADGAVVLPDGTRLPYATLAGIAADLEPARDVALRDPADWTLLGRRMQRLDMIDKCTGAARYGIDLTLPGMLYGAVRAAPVAGGILRGLDDAAAAALPGVVAIVRLDGAVGVLAETTWHAFRAAKALAIDWELPPGEDSADTHRRLAAAITEERRDSRLRDEGDVGTALDGAPFEATYTVPYLAHAPLEPMTATAQLADGVLRIWTGTQVPIFLRDAAAELAGLDTDSVEVNALQSGGSFGRRLEIDYALQAVALAMRAGGRPVKLTWSREEDMGHDFPRPAALARARGAVGDGRVTALDLAIAASSTTASQMGRLGFPAPGPDVAIVAGAWDQPFALPAIRVTGYRAPESVPVSSWRSVGASANAFFHECALDELIARAGADPLAERLRLCSDAPSARVLDAVGELSGWGADLPAGSGRGLAFCLSFGVPAAVVVEVSATDAGLRIDRAFGVAELGRVLDPVNCEAQMQGGIGWGLGHAMLSKLTYSDGHVEQRNFDTYPALRIGQCPEITVQALETTGLVRGIGEPMVPPAAPALANAIFAATGRRIRDLPLADHLGFA